ncbi:alpha/beta hydrolase [Pseudoduganella sp. OTU4001]|uniref:alpha/beta hydrolase n=1 Tax=Pseudoduganella sp. OTU4001 TaxID=3043854 RepID=UPI00313BA6E0
MRLLRIAFAICALLALAAVWRAGSQLSQPVNHPVRMPGNGFENVQIERTRGSLLRVAGAVHCALLMHGIRADRSVMAARAAMLRELGLTSLSIDLQAHGETPGDMITFGYREAQDARNGVAYLRGQGCSKVLVIGQSLGGAAALLGDGPLAADAFVLESVFPAIEDAVANRLAMRFGLAGRLAAPLLYLQVPLRAGVGLDELRPLQVVRKLQVPVLVAGGMRDEQTPPAETRRMFDAAAGRKELWLVEGAAHQDLYAYDPVQYKARLAAFIDVMLVK